MQARVFIGLGSNVGPRQAHLDAALTALDRDGVRVAGAGGFVRSAYEPAGAGGAEVLNGVAEVRTDLAPHALLARLQAIEAGAGRDRARGPARTLDLDLLAYGDRVVDEPDLVVPHPRCTGRWFVLAPWSDLAPEFVLPASPQTGPAAPVVAHAAASLAASRAHRDRGLRRDALPTYAPRAGEAAVLRTREELAAWRAAQSGRVGVVMTMGALHAGHGANVQRAVAECDHVLATLFVNPLQFAPGEDLARYPRTFDADRALLARHGAAAVYAPEPGDLYPPGFSTTVDPGDVAQGWEGAARPDHFRGVATVVLKLWQRTRPDRVYFGRKDAQQVAVVSRMARDLDLGGEIVVCPTVRAPDGLALSSRNRYLEPSARARALLLSRALAAMAADAAAGGAGGTDLLEEADVETEYLAVVDPCTMRPADVRAGAALAVGAIRVDDVRLIDNAWVAAPVRAWLEA